MDRASAAVLLRCLRATGKAQGQADEDASLPSLQSRISISPARCTFLLQRLPSIDVPLPEGCPLASLRRPSMCSNGRPSSCADPKENQNCSLLIFICVTEKRSEDNCKNLARKFAGRGGIKPGQ
jgi:hypothetical protein